MVSTNSTTPAIGVSYAILRPLQCTNPLHTVQGRDKMAQMDGAPKLSYAEPTKYDSIFWVEVDRIEPNPYQPRKEFDEERLRSLAESIRQYGVLQPLVVTRKDVERADGGLSSLYELIAGERRLRASKLAGLREVPVVIRVGEQTDHMKLELAIVENLQREDLNAIDRAKSLAQLSEEFGLSHAEIGAKVGRSREFVSNSIRLLALPEEIQQAVINRKITEGHARALLMLSDRPEEQQTLFKEIMMKKTSVRMAEQLARRIASDKVRKHDKTPEMLEIEKSLMESLGTRVIIENRPNGGRLLIEFSTPEDLSNLAALIAHEQQKPHSIAALIPAMPAPVASPVAVAPASILSSEKEVLPVATLDSTSTVAQELSPQDSPDTPLSPGFIERVTSIGSPEVVSMQQQPAEEQEDEDLYAIRTFSV